MGGDFLGSRRRETAPERWLPRPYAEPSQRFQVNGRLPYYARHALPSRRLPLPSRPQRAHLTTVFCHLVILAGLGACAEKPAVAPTQPQGAPASSAPSAPRRPSEVHMAPVPAGSYQMGAADGEPDEKPVHSVKVDAFELDVNEVSTGDYQACVTSGKCTPAGTDGHCNSGHSDRLSDPINCVDWNQATAYCRPASGSPPRRNGSTPHEAPTLASFRGGMRPPPRKLRAGIALRNTREPAASERPPARVRSGLPTWPATSGSGPRAPIAIIQPRRARDRVESIAAVAGTPTSPRFCAPPTESGRRPTDPTATSDFVARGAPLQAHSVTAGLRATPLVAVRHPAR